MTSHSTAFFSNMFSTVSTFFTVFGAQRLHVFGHDRVEPLRAELRNQMRREDRLLADDPARLLPIRARVAVHESRRECFECGHLLRLLGRTVLQQMPLAIFTPS